MLNSFRSVIELWPTRVSCAADIGATQLQVSKWWQRDSVPADWWMLLLSTERARAAGLTADLLSALAARPPAARDEAVEATA